MVLGASRDVHVAALTAYKSSAFVSASLRYALPADAHCLAGIGVGLITADYLRVHGAGLVGLAAGPSAGKPL